MKFNKKNVVIKKYTFLGKFIQIMNHITFFLPVLQVTFRYTEDLLYNYGTEFIIKCKIR